MSVRMSRIRVLVILSLVGIAASLLLRARAYCISQLPLERGAAAADMNKKKMAEVRRWLDCNLNFVYIESRECITRMAERRAAHMDIDRDRSVCDVFRFLHARLWSGNVKAILDHCRMPFHFESWVMD